MLRDNLVGPIEPMFSSAGANPLALCIARQESSDDRPSCLENPRPEGAESTLTENAPSPFHAEPRHVRYDITRFGDIEDQAVKMERGSKISENRSDTTTSTNDPRNPNLENHMATNPTV